MENYPEFRKLSGTVSKHVALMSELSRLVDGRALMEVSQVEQELACTENHSAAVAEVEAVLANRAVRADDKLRLVLLYALRYEGSEANALHRFVDVLGGCGVPAEQLRLIPAILEQCGGRARCGDLFSNKSFFAVAKKQLQRGIKGVQNVYTQHTPYLAQTLEALAKNKLPVRARAAAARARPAHLRCGARSQPAVPGRRPPGEPLPVRVRLLAAAAAQPGEAAAGGCGLHLWRCARAPEPA